MIEVSRNIEFNKITQYPQNERFITLNIEKYFAQSDMKLSRPQIAIVNALNNPTFKFVVAAVSRRLGKTYIANVIAHLLALTPGKIILVMSPNYALSGISFDLQTKLMVTANLEMERNNLKDRIITLHNGSSVRLGSVNQVDSSVGRSYNFIIFDEAALTTEGQDAFEQQLLPTLDLPNSKALFISTPRGKKNWFYKYFMRGYSSEHPKWISIRADYLENNRTDDEDIKAARSSMSIAKFKQEFEADFTVSEGQIYNFTLENIQDLSEIPLERLEVFMGIDVGFKDPTACIVVGYDAEKDIYYVLEEYQKVEQTTAKHAAKVKALMEKYNVDTIYIDSAAAQTRFDWAAEHDIATIAAKKSVLDGISHVQKIVEQNRLIVDCNCLDTIAMLSHFRWDDRSILTTEKPFRDDNIHMADALRYALYSFNSSGGIT